MPRTIPTARLTAIAAIALLASGAHAATETSTSATGVTVGPISATSSTANVPNSASTSSLSLGAVNKFDTATGVLTGVSASLSGVNVKGTGVPGNHSAEVTWTFGANAPSTTSVSVANGSNSSLAATASFSDLSAYVGAGTLTGSASYKVTAERTKTTGGGSTVTTLDKNTELKQSVTYTYLQHANASFGAATDVNSLALNAGTGFNVYALAGSKGAADTTTLDSVSYSCVSGNCGAFTFSLATFSNLAAGSYVAGLTGFNTTTAGAYSANYLFTFTDHTGVGIGQQQNTLSLTINGTVAAVPEPESYAMMAAGLAAVGFMARRRKKSA